MKIMLDLGSYKRGGRHELKEEGEIKHKNGRTIP